jgi:hypothetical protein
MEAVERPTTNLANVSTKRLLSELEHRAQQQPDMWTTDQVLHVVVIAVVVSVLAHVVEAKENERRLH